jgi:hypothetical protein
MQCGREGREKEKETYDLLSTSAACIAGEERRSCHSLACTTTSVLQTV